METEGKMLRLRSTVRQIYGGRLLLPGDRFPTPVPERTARALIKHHFAREDPTATIKLPSRVERNLIAEELKNTEEQQPEEAAEATQDSRRRYNRRDMEAKK